MYRSLPICFQCLLICPLQELGNTVNFKDCGQNADGGYAYDASSNDVKYDLGLSVHGNH